MQPFVVRASLGLITAGLLIACEGSQPVPLGPSGQALAADQVLATNGTIRYLGLEGGCWALVTPQGKYEPLGLASQFRVDGLRVYAVVRGAPTAVSVCGIAPLVTLDSMRTR